MTSPETPNTQKGKLNRWIRSPWPLVWALLFITIYFTLGEIIKLVLPYTKYNHVPGFVAEIAANKLRPKISYPISEIFNIKGSAGLFVIPYYLILGYLIVLIHVLVKPYYKYAFGVIILVLTFLRIFPDTLLLFDSSDPSISVGTSSNGTIENSRRLSFRSGYSTYSYLGFLAGRTYVHHQLKDVLIETYQMLEEKHPNRTFVIGDCGLKYGGPISFHKEKQNGLQVDFLLPLNEDDAPYKGGNLLNSWDYKLVIDDDGSFEGKNVDLGALASHVTTLQSVSAKHGLVIKEVRMNPTIKKALLGKKLASLLKNVLGRSIKKENSKSPAYYTVTFEVKRNRKPLDFLKRNKDD